MNQYRFSGFNKLTFRNFYFQEDRHGAGDAQIVAKRVIKLVGQTLREYDPERWESVPITYETQWNNPDFPYVNIRQSILIHDAIEKEFNVDVDDKKILMSSVKEVVGFILENHAAV